MLAGLLLGFVAAPLRAQAPVRATTTVSRDTSPDAALMRAFDAEQAGHMREAVQEFRRALRGDNFAVAILGLERSYVSIGRGDSLMVLVDSVLRSRPLDATVRTIQLRTLRGLGRDEQAFAAFEQWRRAVPGEPAPYREYARLLLQSNRTSEADSVLRLAERALGSRRALSFEVAQLRTALGMWTAAAAGWREALATDGYLVTAAQFALQSVPSSARDSLRTVLMAGPPERGARRLLAALELSWGAPRAAWAALSDLPPNDSIAADWTEFAERAEQSGAWGSARDAWVALHRRRPSALLALRAASAALSASDAANALALADSADRRAAGDARILANVLQTRVSALSQLGRLADAERAAQAGATLLDSTARADLARTIAVGWVRVGNVERARAALAIAKIEDEGTAGWLALYDGDLRNARQRLKRDATESPELVLALSILSRTRADSARDVGAAFLALARGDSMGAATRFAAAATAVPEAASLLVATAARLHGAHGDVAGALALWQRLVATYPESAEAPEADLAWARLLRRRGDAAGARSRLEHLILTYPESALVPQARRELEAPARPSE
jgi:tetratricopeptide (TPR) repeat protein